MNNKKTALVFFSYHGEFIPAMVRQITFTTERGLKTSLRNAINRSMTTLHLHYGSCAQIEISCMMGEKRIATAKVTTW